jgi:hypothetical protein
MKTRIARVENSAGLRRDMQVILALFAGVGAWGNGPWYPPVEMRDGWGSLGRGAAGAGEKGLGLRSQGWGASTRLTPRFYSCLYLCLCLYLCPSIEG